MAPLQDMVTPAPSDSANAPAAPPSDVRGGRRPLLGGLDVAVGLMALGAIWGALPARWWPMDVFGTALALLLVVSGGALIAGVPWARRLALATGTITLVAGAALVTTLALTAAHLTGLYGPVGGGGAILLTIVALLILPYLVMLPAAQLFVLARDGQPGSRP